MENVRYLQDENTKTTATIVAQIFENGQKLVSKEILLAKTEIGAEYAKLKAVASMCVGVAIAGGFALVLGTLSLIHLLSSFGMDAWAVYGLVALLYVAAGVGIFFTTYKVRDSSQGNINSTVKGE